MAASLLILRVFLASPDDVPDERRIARTVIDGLEDGHLLRGKVHFQVVAWDDENASTPMDARELPQDSVKRFTGGPSSCDLTLVILWTRLGTPFVGSADRRPHDSGTVSEYEDAMEAGKSVFVYWRSAAPSFDLNNPASKGLQAEYDRVKEFLTRISSKDGSARAGFTRYKDPQEFEKILRHHLEAFVKERLEKDEKERLDRAEKERLDRAEKERLDKASTNRRLRLVAVSLSLAVALAGYFAVAWNRRPGPGPTDDKFTVAGTISGDGVERTAVSQQWPLGHDHINCTDDRPAWSTHDLCLDNRSASIARAILAERPQNKLAVAAGKPECFRALDVDRLVPNLAAPHCGAVTVKMLECLTSTCNQPGGKRTSYTVELQGSTTRNVELKTQSFTSTSTRSRRLRIQYANEIPKTVTPNEWKWSATIREVATNRETVLSNLKASDGSLSGDFNPSSRTLTIDFQ